MSISDIFMIPRWIMEFIIIVPLMIFFNTLADGPYWWKEDIFSLMILYGICWFLWRIVFGSVCWGSYGITDMLQPVKFIAILFFIMVFSSLFFNYRPMEEKDISTEIMASDCPDAKWMVHIYYDYNDGWLHSSESFSVFGNTKTAQEQALKHIEVLKEMHPEYKYGDYSIDLYYMPRKFCQEKHYPLWWSEIKDPDRTSEKQEK